MGEPATEIDLMDSRQGFERFGPWVEKSNGFRLGWIEMKTIVQKSVVDPLGERFYWGNHDEGFEWVSESSSSIQNVYFFHAQLGSDVCRPIWFYDVPTHIYHHISTGWQPIIHTFTLQMSKPSRSATPHHISHTLNTQETNTSLLHILNYTSHIHHIILIDWKCNVSMRLSLAYLSLHLGSLYFLCWWIDENILSGDGRLSTVLMPLFRCINFKLPSMFCTVYTILYISLFNT